MPTPKTPSSSSTAIRRPSAGTLSPADAVKNALTRALTNPKEIYSVIPIGECYDIEVTSLPKNGGLKKWLEKHGFVQTQEEVVKTNGDITEYAMVGKGQYSILPLNRPDTVITLSNLETAPPPAEKQFRVHASSLYKALELEQASSNHVQAAPATQGTQSPPPATHTERLEAKASKTPEELVMGALNDLLDEGSQVTSVRPEGNGYVISTNTPAALANLGAALQGLGFSSINPRKEAVDGVKYGVIDNTVGVVADSLRQALGLPIPAQAPGRG